MVEKKIKLVFFVIFPELWTSVGPIYERAKEDSRFVVQVVLLKNPNPERYLSSTCEAEAFLKSLSIPYLLENNFSLKDFQAQVAFYPAPYASFFSDNLQPEKVVEMGCRIAYVPYGLEVGGGVFNARYQYDTDIPRLAWRIFARSLFQYKNFGRFCSSGNSHVVVTGHPRAELDRKHKLIPHSSAEKKSRGRIVILWTPHFSVLTRRKWSSFLDHYDSILHLFEKRIDLFLLIRPHPFLKSCLSRLESWGPERVEKLFTEINKRDNVLLDTNLNYEPAFKSSSGLMSDAGSFLVEYLHTKKPICYLSGKDDIGLSEEVREFDCFYPGNTKIEIEDFLDRVIRNKSDYLKTKRYNALQKYFEFKSEPPSSLILNNIAKNIDCESSQELDTKISRSSNHEMAFQFWLKATSTFLAPESYYKHQEEKLTQILSLYAVGKFAADIGCGNGRFTEIISKYFEFTEAIDINSKLINEAREHAFKHNINNIAYSIESLEHVETLSTYDFVCCMGVTSGLIDDGIFNQSIWKLKTAMRASSILLMKDTLTLYESENVSWNGYTALYRNVQLYKHAFKQAGLTLFDEQLISEDLTKQRVNSFFLFKN